MSDVWAAQHKVIEDPNAAGIESGPVDVDGSLQIRINPDLIIGGGGLVAPSGMRIGLTEGSRVRVGSVDVLEAVFEHLRDRDRLMLNAQGAGNG